MSTTQATPKATTTTRIAPLYRVLIHNDPITTFEFVHRVLQEIFKKKELEAMRIADEAHMTGIALVDVMGLEEAEFRVDQAKSLARANKFPLRFTIEPE